MIFLGLVRGNNILNDYLIQTSLNWIQTLSCLISKYKLLIAYHTVSSTYSNLYGISKYNIHVLSLVRETLMWWYTGFSKRGYFAYPLITIPSKSFLQIEIFLKKIKEVKHKIIFLSKQLLEKCYKVFIEDIFRD